MANTYDNFVAFDLETTGLNPPCKIIEIGGIKVINNQIVSKFQTLVNPEIKIPYHITNITKIDDAMVTNAPTIDEVLPKFIGFIEKYKLVAHNAAFDMRFLNYFSSKLGFNIKNEVLCSLQLSKKFFPNLNKYDLGSVASYINEKNEHAHRAFHDALVVAKILMQISKNSKLIS